MMVGQSQIARTLDVQTELLLTMMKLWLDLPEGDLGELFGVRQSTVARIYRRGLAVCLPLRMVIDKYNPH